MMRYRKFGSLDWRVSILGFGAMRLPVHNGEADKIDEPTAVGMIRRAIDGGVNYLDTAYPYHRGRSEPLVGKALRDGYRRRVRVATKLPTWLLEKKEDFDHLLGEQLKRLETDYIDFYLLHSLNSANWGRVLRYEAIRSAERAMQDGRIGRLGFSFHDQLPLFKEIVDSYPGWTFCQIQYNYMDTGYQAGSEGLRYAAERGLAIVVMEPLRGGQLAQKPPESVSAVWSESKITASPVERALRWLWNQPEVSTALSGMSSPGEVEENLASAERADAGDLSEAEIRLYAQAKAAYERLKPIPCTRCGYCMPCPVGVDIPANFSLYNEAVSYNYPEGSRRVYNLFFAAEKRADKCVRCGTCEPQCPQSIAVMDWLEKVSILLAAR